MRRFIFIAVVLVVAFVGTTMYCGQVGMGRAASAAKSPEGTVKAAVMALEQRDPAALTPCFTPIPGSVMAGRLMTMFVNMESLEIQNLQAVVVLNEGVGAKVRADYDMVFSTRGYINTEHRSRTLKLVRIDGLWYINEPF